LLYQDMGDYGVAESLYRQALDLRRTALGEQHPAYGSTLENLAALCAATGQESEAMTLMREAAGVYNRMIAQVFSFGSERQRIAFLQVVQGGSASFLSLLWWHSSAFPVAAQLGLDLVLQRKALAAEAMAAQREAVLGERYPDLRSQLQQLTALRGRIAQQVLRGPGPDGLQAHQQLIVESEGERERLEGRLAGQITEMHLERVLQAADSRGVANALPEGTALIEFVRFDVSDFRALLPRTELKRRQARHEALRVARCKDLGLPHPGKQRSAVILGDVLFSQSPPARVEAQRRPARYLAFVVLANSPETVQMKDLGEAEPIDRLVADFRAGTTGEAEVRDMVHDPLRPAADVSTTTGERLRIALFDPLADALGACRRLFLAPDGDLNRLPFEALPLADGRHLLDAYRLSYVSVGRDLLRFQVRSNRESAGPLVVADPDFDLGVGHGLTGGERGDPDAAQPRKGFWGWVFGWRRVASTRYPAPKAVVLSPAAPPPGHLSRDLDRSQYHFARLPGTRAEGERIARRLGVPPLLDAAALEGRLKTCRSPCILHLATHGFFLPDQPRDLNPLGRNLELIGVGDTPGHGRLSGPGMENPMLRSGLALAGANTFFRGAPLPDEAEDGLLTAEDVAGLDLLDTELVVLSACDTGLGAVLFGEGVFGLRRAFIVAGARTLVMSLWKVPDLATAFLMDRLYDNLLTRGLDRDLALSEAQRATRDVTIARLKAEWLTPAMIERLAAGDAEARRSLEALAAKPDDNKPFERPFFWGAFICQGDPSPLPSANTAGEPAPQAGA
jgi:CHAT domain-containing protein